MWETDRLAQHCDSVCDCAGYSDEKYETFVCKRVTLGDYCMRVTAGYDTDCKAQQEILYTSVCGWGQPLCNCVRECVRLCVTEIVQECV